MNCVQKAMWNYSRLYSTADYAVASPHMKHLQNASENQIFEKKNIEKSGFNLLKQFHKMSWKTF